jgi:hypothetical protein
VSVYETLTNRHYETPPWELGRGKPLRMSWEEFVELWHARRADASRGLAGWTPEECQVFQREPTLADVTGTMILGRPIVINGWEPPAPPGRLRLLGGPMDLKEIKAPQNCGEVVIPQLWQARAVAEIDGRDPTFYMHHYCARTGVWRRGRVPSDRHRWPTFEPFPRLTAFLRRIRKVK